MLWKSFEGRFQVVTEPPEGLKLNIKQPKAQRISANPSNLALEGWGDPRSYAKISDADLDACGGLSHSVFGVCRGSHESFRPLMYVLAFFHAVVQACRGTSEPLLFK